MPVFRSVFIALSQNRSLRSFAEHSLVGRKLSSRFVAGMEIEDALRIARTVNSCGMMVTLDSLGESVTSETEAHRAARVYHHLLDAVAERRLKANVSVKLTQMGLELSPVLACEIVESLARHARVNSSFVRVDMEGSHLTQQTLDIVRQIHAKPDLKDSIGVVVQAYLYRSQADVEQLLAEGIRMRLCKGAYMEPPEVAYARKVDVDANYLQLSSMLLKSSVYHGLATHDESIIESIKRYVVQNGIASDSFEFQMLYGVRRDLQRKLVSEGYNVRVYVPFGPQWYPYFMRRLAERPANALFILQNLVRS
jgi:proline dehydrogenase